MSEMLERVAKACFANAMRDVCQDHAVSWETLPEKYRENHRHMARAAIIAMGEPTGVMLWAGREAIETCTKLDPCGKAAEHCYADMLAAALHTFPQPDANNTAREGA